jgi:AsmA protein
MVRFIKILGVFCIVALVTVVGLGVFIRFYLTDERIKELVIPEAERTLGRNVALGDIRVGLLRGIRIDDFVIREKDKKDDFINVKSFVLNYDLLPLLQKKFVVSEIALHEPTVHIFRNQAGRFNFESLTVLKKDQTPASRSGKSDTAVSLPVALAIDRIRIEKAKFVLQDEIGALPTIEAEANAQISVNVGRDLSSIHYKGAMDYRVDATYGDSKPHLQGEGTFDQDRIQFNLIARLVQEQLNVDGTIRNYAAMPSLTLNATAESLNIDRLLTLTAVHSTKTGQPGRPVVTADGGAKSAPMATPPADLVARGQVKIDRALYKGATIKDFFMQYALDKGMLTIDEMRAESFGGELTSNVKVDLKQPDYTYIGKMGLRSMQMTELGSFLAQQMADAVSGTLESSFTFAGAGTDWGKIRQVLTADGSFSLKNGRIRNTSITKSMATLIGLPELNDMSFQDASGTFQIVKGGKVNLTTSMNSQDIKAQTAGTVSLDGGLDLPLTLRLSKELTGRLQNRASIARYLTDEQGEAVFKLKLAGTATDPRPSFDTAVVKKVIEEKALGAINDALSGKKSAEKSPAEKKTGVPQGNAVQELLKGMFDR